MSTIEVNKITPVSGGTNVTLGDSGDTFTIPSGVTMTNNGTSSGFNQFANWSESSGNLLPGNASYGIYLGVNSATASNLLDDYEEGDWTPTWITSGGNLSPSGSVTPASTSGTYTKIGDLVTVQFITGLFSVTGTSGSYQITNMPFTCKADQPAIGVVREYGQTGYLGFMYVNGSSTTAVVYQSPTGGQVNNPYFYGSVTYRVN